MPEKNITQRVINHELMKDVVDDYTPSELIYGPDYDVFWCSFDSDEMETHRFTPSLKLLHPYYQTPHFDSEEDAWKWIESNKVGIRDAFPELSVTLVVLKTKFI